MAETRLCSIPGCEKPHVAKGFCSKHYSNLRRYGDPLVTKSTPKGEPAAFLAEALLSTTDECMIWPFAKNSAGYGQIRLNGITRYVHRIACEHANGAPPSPAHEASHTCGNGHVGCFNPRHLAWKTHYDNHQDRYEHGTVIQGSKHHSAKLSEQDIPNIRRLAEVMSAGDIARQFGVNRETIRDILSGKSWRHVV